LTNQDNRNEYLGIRRIEYNVNKAFNVKAVSTSGKLTLQINTSNKGLYHIRVFDIGGRERKNETITIYAEQTNEEISLAPGVYVWEVKDSKGISLSRKVIIQ
jgi:hypothetical protein